jgi:glycosyltransferase involved in cell wall biosynthesis
VPLLSVVVPTKDRAARLGRALEGARAQTLSDLEIVVVDDGSTDGTRALLEEVASDDARVRVVHLDGGNGAAQARNRGIEVATGKFLAFCDDDDEWHPRKAEVQVEYLEAHPAVGLVGCDFTIVDERTGRSARYRGPQHFTPFAMLWVNVMMGCSFPMIHRSAFATDPRFDASLISAEDWDLWLRCSDEKEVAWLDDVLCRYVLHGPQLSGARERRHQGDAAFFAKHAGRMSEPVKAFHRALLRMLERGGFGPRLRSRARIVATTPPSVTAVIARLSVSSRVGRIVGDPGRPVRTLVRSVRRFEP